MMEKDLQSLGIKYKGNKNICKILLDKSLYLKVLTKVIFLEIS